MVFANLDIGPGGLTREILRANPTKLVAIEKDKSFIPILEVRNLLLGSDLKEIKAAFPSSFEYVVGDALDLLFPIPSDTFNAVQVVGNLPFCIASPLLLKLCRESASKNSALFPSHLGFGMLFMFQKEVAKVSFISLENTLLHA